MELLTTFLTVYAAAILGDAGWMLWCCHKCKEEFCGFTLHGHIILACISWLIAWCIC